MFIINYIRTRSVAWQHLLCALLATAVFSLRWSNCLPFSGYTPVLDNSDLLSITGTSLIYLNESFSFPIGFAKGLSFPFEVASITRGPVPLFAILFKGLAQFFPSFSGFYYFVLVELLAVFFAAYLTCLLLSSFKVTSFWLKLLGSALVALSFPLLFRSSNYYGCTFIVAGFTVYLLGAYWYMRIYKQADWKSLLLFACIFPIAALIDNYVLFALLLLTFFCLCFNCFEAILNNDRLNRMRALFVALALLLGVVLSSQVLFILGNLRNLQTPPGRAALLVGRHDTSWGYGGGGYGGGFHVADVLALVVPPKDSDEKAFTYRRCGPTAYLSRWGWPLTTNNLQDGQYEGFAYIGTIPIGILLFLFITAVIAFIGNLKRSWAGFRMRLMAGFFMRRGLFSLPMTMGLSAFLLFIYSWGYIIHVGGVRFNNIMTPSLGLAILWPKLIFVRSLGRLDIPLVWFVVIGAVVLLNKYLQKNMCFSDKRKKVLCAVILISLTIAHVYEIRGYLRPPQVVRGNYITNVFGPADQAAIKELLRNKKAIMLVPALRDNLEWTRIGYALAFYSKIPISGTTVGFAELEEQLKQYDLDIACILSGRIKELISRYGDVAIAVPPGIAGRIVSASDVPFKAYRLQNPDVGILIPDTN